MVADFTIKKNKIESGTIQKQEGIIMKAKENNTQKKTKKLSSKELSWVLYDVGNSAYTLLACALIPIWYKSLAVGDGAGQISSDRATAYYAVAIAVMTVVSALIGPVVWCDSRSIVRKVKNGYFFN